MENRINILERLFGDYEAVFEEARYYSDDEAQEHWIELKARIEAEAAKLEMRLKRNQRRVDKRNEALNQFFSSTIDDQLAVEHIVIDSISSDFSRKKWSEIRVVFYNVMLNDKTWDAIRIKFVTDSAGRNKYGDFIRMMKAIVTQIFLIKAAGRVKARVITTGNFLTLRGRTKDRFCNSDAKLQSNVWRKLPI